MCSLQSTDQSVFCVTYMNDDSCIMHPKSYQTLALLIVTYLFNCTLLASNIWISQPREPKHGRGTSTYDAEISEWIWNGWSLCSGVSLQTYGAAEL